jgi:hypothetical protein
MKKILHPVELKNVSYEGNVFKFQKKLKGLTFFTATLMLMFFSYTGSANQFIEKSTNLKLCTHFNELHFEEDWVLIFQDSITKVSYKKITCEGTPSIKLKIENLSNRDISLTYKLSTSNQESKLISLFSLQTLEGIYSSEYQTVLVEPFSSETEPIIQISHK